MAKKMKKSQQYYSITINGKRTQIYKPQLVKNIAKQKKLINSLEQDKIFSVGPSNLVLNMEREKLFLLESQVKKLRKNMSPKNRQLILSINTLNKQLKQAKPNIKIAQKSIEAPFSEVDWGMIIGYKAKYGVPLTAYEESLLQWHNDSKYYTERNSSEFWTAYNYYFEEPKYLPRLMAYIEETK